MSGLDLETDILVIGGGTAATAASRHAPQKDHAMPASAQSLARRPAVTGDYPLLSARYGQAGSSIAALHALSPTRLATGTSPP